MWMTNYSFTFLFPSQVARCGCATSPTMQWTIRYLPASLLPPPHLSSQWLKWTKNLQTHKMFQEAAKQNDKFQVVANETKGKNKKKLCCTHIQSGKFPSWLSVHGLSAAPVMLSNSMCVLLPGSSSAKYSYKQWKTNKQDVKNENTIMRRGKYYYKHNSCILKWLFVFLVIFFKMCSYCICF